MRDIICSNSNLNRATWLSSSFPVASRTAASYNAWIFVHRFQRTDSLSKVPHVISAAASTSASVGQSSGKKVSSPREGREVKSFSSQRTPC